MHDDDFRNDSKKTSSGEKSNIVFYRVVTALMRFFTVTKGKKQLPLGGHEDAISFFQSRALFLIRPCIQTSLHMNTPQRKSVNNRIKHLGRMVQGGSIFSKTFLRMLKPPTPNNIRTIHRTTKTSQL
jgi:hypothetical protein